MGVSPSTFQLVFFFPNFLRHGKTRRSLWCIVSCEFLLILCFPGRLKGIKQKLDQNSSFPAKNLHIYTWCSSWRCFFYHIKRTNSSLSITSFWRYPMVLNFPKALSFCSDIIKIQVQFAKQDQDIFSECTKKTPVSWIWPNHSDKKTTWATKW